MYKKQFVFKMFSFHYERRHVMETKKFKISKLTCALKKNVYIIKKKNKIKKK